jgi:hypothetical protein
MRWTAILVAVLVGCGGAAEPFEPPIWEADAAMPEEDAYGYDDADLEGDDAAEPVEDAGELDAADPVEDASAPEDAAEPEPDAEPGEDAGGPEEDAGDPYEPPDDAGEPEPDAGPIGCTWDWQCPHGALDPCQRAVCHQGACTTASVSEMIGAVGSQDMYLRNPSAHTVSLRGLSACLSYDKEGELETVCRSLDSIAVPAGTAFYGGVSQLRTAWNGVYQASLVLSADPAVVCDHVFRRDPGDADLQDAAEVSGEWSGQSVRTYLGTLPATACADGPVNAVPSAWASCRLCETGKVPAGPGTSAEASVYEDCR